APAPDAEWPCPALRCQAPRYKRLAFCLRHLSFLNHGILHDINSARLNGDEKALAKAEGLAIRMIARAENIDPYEKAPPAPNQSFISTEMREAGERRMSHWDYRVASGAGPFPSYQARLIPYEY